MHKLDDFFHNSQCEFQLGISDYAQYKPNLMRLPEVAFIGRSNVGKSSLINALLNKRHLAHTSNTPGRTQQLNFFRVNKVFTLVDMPGYGFAKAGKHNIHAWEQVISDYLQQSTQLRQIFVLIDSRRQLMPIDDEFLVFALLKQLPVKLIFTKTDLLKPNDYKQLLQQTQNLLRVSYAGMDSEILGVSSKNNQGISELRACLGRLLAIH